MDEEPEIRVGEIEVFKIPGPPTPEDPVDEDEARGLDFHHRLEPPYEGVEWLPAGWFWQARKRGVGPDEGPVGLFETPGDAIADAIVTLREGGGEPRQGFLNGPSRAPGAWRMESAR